MEPAQFSRCWPWLEAALKRGNEHNLTREDLERELTSNRAQLWPGERSAIVTQLIQANEGRFVHAWLAGGNLNELRAMRAGIEAWGRAQGCDFASINGRRGWDRIYGDYARAGTELRKALK